MPRRAELRPLVNFNNNNLMREAGARLLENGVRRRRRLNGLAAELRADRADAIGIATDSRANGKQRRCG